MLLAFSVECIFPKAFADGCEIGVHHFFGGGGVFEEQECAGEAVFVKEQFDAGVAALNARCDRFGDVLSAVRVDI